MRRVKISVPLEVCKARALEYLRGKTYVKASSVGVAIWPDSLFHSQGAAAAAGRTLKELEREGKIKWSRSDYDWGWQIIP